MAIFISNKFNQRFVRDHFNKDIVIESDTATEVVRNEDKLVTGNWSDYTGEGTVSNGQVTFGGVPNKMQMSRAGIEGEHSQQLTSRGNSKQMFRTRQALEYIDFR